MAAKSSMSSEESVAAKAQVGPCGYLYIYDGKTFPTEEASLLGNLYPEGEVFSLPLLYDLTVEAAFHLTVKAVHKKMDQTTLNVRLTSFMREVIVFKGARLFQPIFYGLGLKKVCEGARDLFGYGAFTPADAPSRVFNVEQFIEKSGIPWKSQICGIAVTRGFKERLMYGKLVVLPTLLENVRIGGCDAVKIPLFDEELFSSNKDEVEHFYHPGVSEYLFYSFFTQVGQALRIRDIGQVVKACEEQFLKDQYKMAKLATHKEYPAQVLSSADPGGLMLIDAAASELALSYGMSFLDSPQEQTSCLNYQSWPLFSDAETPQQRRAALVEFCAKLSVHVHAQIFSSNSILYLNRVGRTTQGAGATRGSSGADVSFNNYFLHGGLAHLKDLFVLEGGRCVRESVSRSPKTGEGSLFSVNHLAYSAGFCPQILARLCFYLQFAQHQKISISSQQSLKNYLCTAANSGVCETCGGATPASCIHTLKFRLEDRFPGVLHTCKREPYLITGVTGAFNDLGILGNFASFREREDDAGQAETHQRDTYWRLTQRITDKLNEMGVGTEEEEGLIKDAKSFVKTFKEIDLLVDREAVTFINNMIKNNVNFRDSIKNINHVMQIVCNYHWLPSCPIFNILYARSILTVIQDIALPVCAAYEQDNPVTGGTVGDWLKLHFQTLWTNFKSACFDKGVLTGGEVKVLHATDHQATGGAVTCTFFDVSGDVTRVRPSPSQFQVRLSRPLVTVPKMIKLKNRVLFCNLGNSSEAIQNSFLRTTKKEQYIVNGPYMIFLNAFHKTLFPQAKISSLYLWNIISDKKQIPLVPGVDETALKELVKYVNSNSLIHDESNVIDTIPRTMKEYALQRLNNAILRSCGQTQFYSSVFHALTPVVQRLASEEYPHELKSRTFKSIEEYETLVKNLTSTTVVTSLKESILDVGTTRPVVTVPVIINKYSGINGNAQIFQCAAVGYFSGRGVDRNLSVDGGKSFYKKPMNWTFMRHKYAFMTTLTDAVIRRANPATTWTVSEVDVLKKNITNILVQSEPDVVPKIVLEFVKLLGKGCRVLTREDVDFYLGRSSFLSLEVLRLLGVLTDSLGEGDWNTDEVGEILSRDGGEKENDLESLAFISLDEATSATRPEEINTPTMLPMLNRKRKFGVIGISEIDL